MVAMLWVGVAAASSGCPGRAESPEEEVVEQGPGDAVTEEDVELLRDLDLFLDWEALQAWEPEEGRP